MNKKDHNTLCMMIVDWEHSKGSTSEAIGRGLCIADVRDRFNITDDDLAVNRAFALCRKLGDDSDELFDAVMELVESDYEGLVDAIDSANSFEVVRTMAQERMSRAMRRG